MSSADEFVLGVLGYLGVGDDDYSESEFNDIVVDLKVRDLENQKKSLKIAVGRIRDMRSANFSLGLDDSVQTLRDVESVINAMCDSIDAKIKNIDTEHNEI